MLRYKKIYVPIYANWRFHEKKFGAIFKNFMNQEGIRLKDRMKAGISTSQLSRLKKDRQT